MSQGIFGIIDFRNPIADRDALGNAMAAYLKMSGIGELSVASGPGHVIGMQRAAADSVSRQTGVEHHADAGLTAVMHGEVNNYRELLSQHPPSGRPCHGDLDLALRMYRHNGAHFARFINGLFTIGILDERDKTFYLMNDRFGLAHQLYWTVVDGRLIFATHLKTLLTCPGVRRELDHEGLNLFLKYAYITSPWSILKGINKLPPGHILTFRDGKAETAPYWQFDAVTRPV
ncbi:asparagine synthase, partial [bacterium]|nr:asparagine synthase [bacterium]